MVPPIDIAQICYDIVFLKHFPYFVQNEQLIETHPYGVIEYCKRKTFNEFPFLKPTPHLLQVFPNTYRARKFLNNVQHRTNRYAIQSMIDFVFYNPAFYAEYGLCVFHETPPITEITLAIELIYKTEYLNTVETLTYAEMKELVVRFLYALYHYYNTMYTFTYVDSMEDVYKYLFM